MDKCRYCNGKLLKLGSYGMFTGFITCEDCKLVYWLGQDKND